MTAIEKNRRPAFDEQGAAPMAAAHSSYHFLLIIQYKREREHAPNNIRPHHIWKFCHPVMKLTGFSTITS